MSELRLAGNFINLPLFNYGHLQVVFDEGNSQFEYEVQAPANVFLGSWNYPNIPRDHTNLDFTPNYGIEGKYAITTLDLGDRSADSVWNVLTSVYLQFSTKGTNIDYDFNKNSNSFVTSLLSVIGIDVSDVLAGATPSEVSSFPGEGVNVLNNPGDAFPLILTGGTENDIFHAGVLDDDIDAKSGNDTIKGGKGNDFLNGGTGFDTYIINPYDGSDTIIDEDGLGVIQFNNINVSGRGNVADDNNWIKIDDVWVDKENNFYYQLLPQSDGSNDLVATLVTRGDGIAQTKIKAWQDGQLGITLGENTPPDNPVFDHTILGDLQPEDLDAETDGIQIGYDDLGNVIVGTEAAPDRVDTLLGSIGNDLIQSFGGNDDVSGKYGADRIEGGAGQDKLEGGAGSDIVLGEAGSDIVGGNEADDLLYAETEYTLAEAYTLGETQAANGQKGDLLDGGAGDDRLFGEAGKDILMGGMGKDVLMGLGGDDTIEGDVSITAAERNRAVSRSEPAENSFHRLYNFSTTLDVVTPDIGDDDVIYAGAGNDWIFAQGGNDFIDAGADDDVIFGEGGNDFILGQAGNDVMTARRTQGLRMLCRD